MLAGLPSASFPLAGGWNLIGYPLGQVRSVADALAPIAGNYTRVFGYDAFDGADPWAVFDVTVPALGEPADLGDPPRRAGDRHDPNVEFYYPRARFYNPENGRFLNQDSFPGSVFERDTARRPKHDPADRAGQARLQRRRPHLGRKIAAGESGPNPGQAERLPSAWRQPPAR